MTFSNLTALFGAMLVLALIPSPSVFAVIARSLASGFTQGIVTALGVVTGDVVFILAAVLGLSAIAETTGNFFTLVKYLGASYLIWLGLGLWRSKAKTVELGAVQPASWVSNFLCGLLITLSDPKAVLFYMSFFPAFLDLSRISILDISTVLILAGVAVGGTKVAYAYAADKSRLLLNSSKAEQRMNIIAGGVMIGTGILLVNKP